MNILKSYKFRLGGIDFNVTIEGIVGKAVQKKLYGYDALGTHYHAGFEWFFVTRYPITVYTETGAQLYETGLVCIPPNFIHTTNNRSNFKITLSFKPCKDSGGAFAAFMLEKFHSDIITTAKISERAAAHIPELEEAFRSDLEISEEKAEALLKVLFSDIFLENADNIKSGHSKGSGDYLVKIDNIIGDFRSEITLSSVAEVLGVCTRQASRIIKKNYGLTLSGLVERKKLGIARALLAESDMNISEIVDYIDFSSVSFFHSRFKKIYGITPAEYRKSCKQQNEA